MTPRREFRAVSLDLWSTSLIERPDAEQRLREARLTFLRERLSPPGGRAISRDEVDRAEEHFLQELRALGKHAVEADPSTVVRRYAEILGQRLPRSLEELAAEFARVGLSLDGPSANPEAESLIARIEAGGLPVVAITDTGRPERVWQEYLRDRTGLRFQHIVTSCEVGRAKPDPAIFRAAAARLGLPPDTIVHIGDRWDRDVLGARGVGFGAVLYSGLREPPSDHEDPLPNPEETRRAGAILVRRLDDPALSALLE